MDTICGIHAVREAIESSSRPIEHVAIQRGLANPRLQQLIDLCRSKGVGIRFEPAAALDRMAQGAHHQGVVASVGGHSYSSLEGFIDSPAQSVLILALDGVQDTHNLGALIRTACAAGADAVMVPERRSAGLTPAAVQAAAGAVAHTPVVRVTNLANALEQLKAANYWVVGLDERGDKAYYEADYRGRSIIVAGGEEKGLHELIKKKCDFLVRIPAPGKIATLNVSVAAGIVLFEAARQRQNAVASDK